MDLVVELESHGAIMHDQHIVLKSGRHGSDYVNLDFMFPHMMFMQALGRRMAEVIYDHLPRHSIDALVAPAVGGVALLQWVGAAVEAYFGDSPLLLWADKKGDDFVFERARWQGDLQGLHVVGVEDIVTSGGSLKSTLAAATAAGARVDMGVAVWRRGAATAESMSIPRFEALIGIGYPDYVREECPMCAAGQPIAEDVGHGADFKQADPDYPGGYVSLLS